MRRTQNDAFSFLMGSGKKRKRPTTTSRYVLCPIGCGKHVADFEINAHLDICLQQQQQQENSSKGGENSNKNKIAPSSSPSVSPARVSVAASPARTPSPTRNLYPYHPTLKHCSPKLNAKHDGKCNSPEPTVNAFSHMMKRSKQVFAQPGIERFAQRMHLNEDGTVTVYTYSTCPGLSQPENIRWSTMVELKGKSPSVFGETTKIVELTVSSAIEPAKKQPSRLVRRHSRLSIPLLKSILQKSIRRRKPLPSLRVSMELADKAIDQLLRRLPIIILEDSTLHPSFLLLTWLMIANSRDFQPPPSIMVKVFCAVYEIASCPWQDHLKAEEQLADPTTVTPRAEEAPVLPPEELSIFSFHKPGIDGTMELGESLVWSMLVRKHYGGMNCDMRMLDQFANAWKSRFESDGIDKDIEMRLAGFTTASSSSAATNKLQWADVPWTIHKSSSSSSSSISQQASSQSLTQMQSQAQPTTTTTTITTATVAAATTTIRRKDAMSRVGPICQQGLEKLQFADITTEGVDFHCSGIIDSIMLDRDLVEECFAICKREETAIEAASTFQPIPKNASNELHARKEWLQGFLKTCMWNYYSSTNRRRSLTTSTTAAAKSNTNDRIKTQLWDSKVLPRAKAFAESFVRDRLS